MILVSHMHGDHVGNAHTRAVDAGTCASPDMSVSAVPNSNAANIALAKKAKIVTGSDMPSFFAAKLRPTAATRPIRSWRASAAVSPWAACASPP